MYEGFLRQSSAAKRPVPDTGGIFSGTLHTDQILWGLVKFHTGGDESKDRAVPKALQGFLRKPSEHSSKKSIPIFSTRSADRGRAGGKTADCFPSPRTPNGAEQGRFLHRRYSPDEKSSVSAHPFGERFSFWEDFRIQLKKLPSDLFSPKSFGLDRFFGLLNESFSLNLRPGAFRFRL